MLKLFARVFTALFALVSLLTMWACDPIPTKELTREDKMIDLRAIMAIFDNYYAPLNYKSTRNPQLDPTKPAPNQLSNYEKLKLRYLKAAAKTKNNQEFYDLVHRFVSEFKDAHTSVRIKGANLPGLVKVSYLGFSGHRAGNGLLVTDLLPTIMKQDGSHYPIERGDIVTHINGEPLTQYVLREMVPHRDLGQDTANLTYHMNGAFNRVSIQNGVAPEGTNVKLTVNRKGRAIEVELPWVVKDLFDFQIEQETVRNALTQPVLKLKVSDPSVRQESFYISFLDFAGNEIMLNPDKMAAYAKRSRHAKGLKYLDNFKFMSDIVGWKIHSALPGQEEEPEGIEKLRLERAVPDDAVPVAEAKTFPAYMRPVEEYNTQGQPTGKKKIMGYIRIDTFSPGADEATVLEEFRLTLQHFQNFGVEDIVIDLLNNGGGSVSLVYQLAHLLTNQKIKNHQIQFGLNENWIVDMQRGALWGPSDAEKEIQKRLFADLSRQRAEGKRISSSYPIEQLLPFMLKPNTALQKNFNVVMLVNEMCASAADIFSSTLKDNNMAILMGMQTMGAGGNVTPHNNFQSPISHIKVNQTESLLVDINGNYIENNGVKPHIEVDTSLFAHVGYGPLVDAAFNVLSTPKLKSIGSKRGAPTPARVVTRTVEHNGKEKVAACVEALTTNDKS